MKATLLGMVASGLLCALAVASPSPNTDPPPAAPAASPLPVDDGRGTDYVVDKTNNICGLDTPRQLTNPAAVDYQKLLDATPEVRKMKTEKVSKSSAKGIQLMAAAEERVRKACVKVMGQKGHCSVWKKIKRRDGKKLSDLTAKVKAHI